MAGHAYDFVVMGAYNCSTVVWLVYVLMPETVHRNLKDLPQNDLEQWNARTATSVTAMILPLSLVAVALAILLLLLYLDGGHRSSAGNIPGGGSGCANPAG